MQTLIAVAATTLPTALYVWLIWWLDRYEKEPLPLLLAAFVWGALPAIGIALLFEVALDPYLRVTPLGPGLSNWGLAPMVEEPVKALALVALFKYARRNFDGPLDGIVYGALVGFGFSMTENLLFYLLGTLEQLPGNFWSRSILFGTAHAFFTAVVGLSLGSARFVSRSSVRYSLFSLGLALSILLHALHNLAAGYKQAGVLLALSWLVQSSGVLVLLAVAGLAWRHERAAIERELIEEIVLGTISAEDYVEAMLLRRRAQSLLHALLSGGLVRLQLRWQLHQRMTRLAFCKHQLGIGDRFRSCDERDGLRRAIVTTRNNLARA